MMTGDQFILVAGELARAKTEAHWRSAVSRAYYAAFHVARVAIEPIVHVPRGPQAHKFTCDWLTAQTKPEISEAGSSLSQLYSKRLEADYDVEARTVDGNDAGLNVCRAKAIITAIQKHL
jgi:hypothetical protein